MTSAVKTECVNGRSAHFATEGDADAEVLDRKIREACFGKRGKPAVRHVERCEPCDMWMIVTPEQQGNRRSRRG
jgi:hypothetical protein